MQFKLLGLIGNPVKHSFSKLYFEDKFLKEGITDFKYGLFQLNSIKELPLLVENEKNLIGFNVTSPFKEQIIDYLDFIDAEAEKIGAVNTVKIKDGKLFGYNTDSFGFKKALMLNCDISKVRSAVILSTGGASKAVSYALKELGISFIFVSASKVSKKDNIISYNELNNKDIIKNIDLIVNATPCGMDTYPPICPIDTEKITDKHIVFDLIYNPAETLLLKKAKQKGAETVNGLQMLYFQADKSWEIWTKKE